MRNSDGILHRARKMLVEALRMLDERTLSQRIDEPMDTLLEEFLSSPQAKAGADLLEACQAFLAQAFEKVVPVARRLVPAQARDEAAAVLWEEYQGTHADGYHGAVLDALDTNGPGVPLVVSRLAEALKARLRRDHANWVTRRFLLVSDWSVRCAMASLLLSELTALLPPEMQGSRPEQWADHVHELLMLRLGAEERLVSAGLSDLV